MHANITSPLLVPLRGDDCGGRLNAGALTASAGSGTARTRTATYREKKLYFVRETKSTLDSEERRSKENQKIACGRKHFETIGVDFDVVTSLRQVNF